MPQMQKGVSAVQMTTNDELLRALVAGGNLDVQLGGIFDLSPAPLPDRLDFSRIEGMMLGLAVGDALGNTTESMLPGQRRAFYGEIRDYLPNKHANGRCVGLPSDDSQLAYWTLEQLLADDGLEPERLGARFCASQIFGIGSAVREFIGRFGAGLPWYECGSKSAGNGALMRIAPLLIPHLGDPSLGLWADVALAAALTHNDAASTAGCVAFAAMLWDLLALDAAPEPLWWVQRYAGVACDIEGETHHKPRGGAHMEYSGPIWRFVEEYVPRAFEERLTVRDACDLWYSGAYLLETVPSALYILMRHADDPEEAIIRALNDTKDNDTIAAIVGAAIGALYGAEALPQRWRDGLLGRTSHDDDGRAFALLSEARRRWACPDTSEGSGD